MCFYFRSLKPLESAACDSPHHQKCAEPHLLNFRGFSPKTGGLFSKKKLALDNPQQAGIPLSISELSLAWGAT